MRGRTHVIRSLTEIYPEVVSRQGDVLVVGAGVAGLLIATRLSHAGVRVIVLESGSEHQEGDSHPLNEVEYARAVYAGATDGRARCLGGTSTLWGGAMLPYQAADLTMAGWPIAPEALALYEKQVEELFELPGGCYEVDDPMYRADRNSCSYVGRLPKWPVFRRRSLATLFDKELRSCKGPEVWLNAAATGFTFAEDGRIHAVTATAPNGR